MSDNLKKSRNEIPVLDVITPLFTKGRLLVSKVEYLIQLSRGDKNDPYVVVQVGSSKFKTKII